MSPQGAQKGRALAPCRPPATRSVAALRGARVPRVPEALAGSPQLCLKLGFVLGGLTVEIGTGRSSLGCRVWLFKLFVVLRNALTAAQGCWPGFPSRSQLHSRSGRPDRAVRHRVQTSGSPGCGAVSLCTRPTLLCPWRSCGSARDAEPWPLPPPAEIPRGSSAASVGCRAHREGRARARLSGRPARTPPLGASGKDRDGAVSWRARVEGGGPVMMTMNRDGSSCLSICKEEEVSTEGGSLSSRSTEKLPGRGLGAPDHAHEEAARRMSEASWADREVSFKCGVAVRWETCCLSVLGSGAHGKCSVSTS